MRVRRFGFLFVVAVVIALILSLATAFAEAQYYGPSPVQSLVQGNLNLVHGSRYGGYGQQYFQPPYGYDQYQQSPQQRRPLNTLERSILGGAIGALGARTATKNGRVIAGVALGGVLIGALTGRHQNQQEQYQQPMQSTGRGQLVPAPQYQQESPQQPQQAPNMGAEPWPTQSESESATLPNMQAKNCTNMWGEVYDWDQSTGIWLAAGESVSLPTSTRGGYRMLASILSASGGQTIRSWADSRFVDSTGSILFVEPK